MAGGKLRDEYISPREAAALLGCRSEVIEVGLRNRTFPLGWAWCTIEEGRRGQWHYRSPRQGFLKAIETGVVPYIRTPAEIISEMY